MFKKLLKKIGFDNDHFIYPGKINESGFDAPNARHRNHGSCSNNFTGKGTFSLSRVADYYKFPSIQYYISKYNSFPSEIKIDFWCKLDDLKKSVDKCKTDFYYESGSCGHKVTGEIIDYTQFDYNNFVFTLANKKMLVYLTFIKQYNSENEHTNELLKANNGVAVSASVLFNPFLHSLDYLETNFLKDILPIERLVIKSEDVRSINFITHNGQYLTTNSVKIQPPTIDFSLNYLYEFEAKNKFIIDSLKGDKSGLVLFHGPPGGGKTMYLRYLVCELKDQKLLWLPSNMVDQISSPQFLNFMMNFKNSILIIEDGELCLKGGDDRNMAVTNLLNLADGMLSDALNIKIVATFNTEIKNIDQALLREGRLILKHEFKALPATQATELSKKLGINKTYTEPRTLAQIYNENKEFKEETKSTEKVGFKTT